MAPTFLDLSLGAIEIGTLLASVIYGISLVQTYVYYTTCRQDRLWLKVMVAGVCFLETLHIILTWAYLYFLTVAGFGNVVALLRLPWYFCVSVTVQAAAGTVAQLFFVWRVYLLSQRKWWLIVVPTLGALMKTTAAVLSTTFSIKVDILPLFQARYGYTGYVATISSVVTDVWNTAVLCWFLYSRRTRHSHGIINWIILWAIESGIMTSLAAILIVIFWSLTPENGLWLAMMLIYSHLYSNSLLVSLNHRLSNQRSCPPQQPASSLQSDFRPLGFKQSQAQTYDLSAAEEALPTKRNDGRGIDSISMGHLPVRHE